MKDVTVTYKTVPYNPVYALISGDVVSGVFLSQLIEWADPGHLNSGWVCKTQEEWQARTGLGISQQIRIRRKLKLRGFISEKSQGRPKTVFIRLNMEMVEAAIKRLGE